MTNSIVLLSLHLIINSLLNSYYKFLKQESQQTKIK